MGMYNYLNGEQVKCFPVSTTHIDEYENRVEISSMGGMLDGYKTGDEVPYRSCIYNYGKNFIVFDYSWNYEGEGYVVHVIEDGKLQGSYNLEEFNEVIQIDTIVIDNHGSVLNIHSIEDLHKIVEDYDKYVKTGYFKSEEFRYTRDLFEEYISGVREGNENTELYERHNKLIDELKDKTMNIFWNKWFVEDNKIESNNIGYIIEQLLGCNKDTEYMTRMLELYKRDCKDFSKEVEEYKEWVKDYFEPENVNMVINTVLEGK